MIVKRVREREIWNVKREERENREERIKERNMNIRNEQAKIAK